MSRICHSCAAVSAIVSTCMKCTTEFIPRNQTKDSTWIIMLFGELFYFQFSLLLTSSPRRTFSTCLRWHNRSWWMNVNKQNWNDLNQSKVIIYFHLRTMSNCGDAPTIRWLMARIYWLKFWNVYQISCESMWTIESMCNACIRHTHILAAADIVFQQLSKMVIRLLLRDKDFQRQITLQRSSV